MFKKPVGMRKALGLMLAVSAFTLAACGGGQETAAPADEPNDDAAAPAEEGGAPAFGWTNAMEDFQVGDRFFSEETIDVSLLFRELAETPWQDDWLMVQRLYEMTGVNLASNTTAILHDDFATQRQLLIATGNAPELMPFIYGQDIPQFVAGGAMLPLNDYFQHMPHFRALLDEWDLHEEFEHLRQPDGNFYMLPGMQEDTRVRFTVAMRKDILDELGLDVPDTWDEIRDVLEAVEAAFPGSFPYQEAWGWSSTANIASRTWGVRFGWGLGNGLILDHDANTHSHIALMPELRDFTEYWAGLVADGLLLDESLVDGFESWERFLNGYSFMTGTNGADMHASFTRDMHQLNEDGMPYGPFGRENFEIVTLPIPNGPTGMVGEARLNNGMILNSSIAEREDFVAILQFIDWLWYSEEGREFALWGIEGETFERDADGRRVLKEGFSNHSFSFGGNAEMADEWTQMRRDLGFGETVWLPTQGGSRDLLTSTLDQSGVDLHMANTERVPHAPNPAPPFDVEEAEIMSTLANQLADMTNVAVREFVVGARELNDETWAAFVAQIEAAGVQRLLDTADEAHARERLGQ